MNSKQKISVAVSVALALFFALPWISIFDQAQQFQQVIPPESARMRLLFMTISVFLGSLMFFQFNFYWQSRHGSNKRWFSNFGQLLINLILIVLLSGFFHRISIRLLNIDPSTSFISLYIIRNLGISVISLLVTYVYVAAERSKLDRINLLTLKNEKMENEMSALKAQIDPHFLFNSLNSLTGVIRQDQKEAIRFVDHLSETLRYTLDHKDDNLVTLHEEIEYLRSYDYMMQIRFEDGFNIDNQIEPGDLEKRIPQFALQLLVENAIKHNIVSAKKPLTIRLASDGNHLKVCNNLHTKKSHARGYGIGLANLSKRYELLGFDPLEINKSKNEFSVTLALI